MRTTRALLSRRDLADLFGVSLATVDRLRQADFPPPIAVGATLRWLPDDIEAWLARRRGGPAAQHRGRRKGAEELLA